MTSLQDSLLKQDQLFDACVSLLKDAPIGADSKGPTNEYSERLDAVINTLLSCTPLEEVCVLDKVLDWATFNAPEAGNWLLANLKGEVEHSSIRPVRGGKAECVLFAIPVLFPKGSVFEGRLVGEEGIQALCHSVQTSKLVDEYARCTLSGTMLHYTEIAGRSFGELKQLASELFEQHEEERQPVLQIPSWLYEEEAPVLTDWASTFNVDLMFILGVASTSNDRLPTLFAVEAETEDNEIPGLPPAPHTGTMPNGVPWEEFSAQQLAYLTVASEIPLRVCEPTALYSAMEGALELARQTVLQMTVLEIEDTLSIGRDMLVAQVVPLCLHKDGIPTHVQARLVMSAAPAHNVLAVNWPILPHELGLSEAANALLTALNLCGISVDEEGASLDQLEAGLELH